MTKRVYLDNAATTELDPSVLEAMVMVMKEDFGNPSSTHSFGRKTKGAIETSRKKIAGLINAKSSEIIFTSGGTEADNLAIASAVLDLGVTHIISSCIEHHAVGHTIENICTKNKIGYSLVNLTTNGHVDIKHLEELLSKNPNSLVSLMHANNEIGNLLDIDKVGELCEKYKAFFHSDTVQTMGHYQLDVQKSKIHFLTCGAHKFHGPKGVGFLYKSEKLKINPLIHGGAQERNLRGGTENLYGIVGMAKALEIACAEMKEHTDHILGLKNYMIDLVTKEIPGVSFNGDYNGKSLYTVLNISFPPNENNDMLLFKLDINGVAASGGSACSSGSNKGSHVLEALKVNPDRVNIRFSFSKYTQKEDIDYAVGKLCEILEIKAVIK
ncbi:MAG TPA: cysteine desulfurase family protein [Flavobacteriales bacterium]|nr:cysteine desulfurase family protein [Flavobacteriales bacterium]